MSLNGSSLATAGGLVVVITFLEEFLQVDLVEVLTVGELGDASQDDVDEFDVQTTGKESAKNLGLDTLLRLFDDVTKHRPELLSDQEAEERVSAANHGNDDAGDEHCGKRDCLNVFSNLGSDRRRDGEVRPKQLVIVDEELALPQDDQCEDVKAILGEEKLSHFQRHAGAE